MAVCDTINCKNRANLVNGYCPNCVKNREKPKSTHKYKCNGCNEVADKDDQCLCCEYCSSWYHIECVNIPTQLYDILQDKTRSEGMTWYCTKCNDKAKEAVTKFASLEQSTKKLQTEMIAVQDKIESIEKTIKSNVKSSISESIAEKEDIDYRKYNLIVYGLPEPTNINQAEVWDTDAKIEEDIKTIEKIIKDELGVGMSPRNGIRDARRLGMKKADKKARPLRICFDDIEVKRDVLNSAKQLRKSKTPVCKNLYINPDLTEKQRKIEAELRTEMWKRREKGENAIIKKGKIVITSSDVKKTRSVPIKKTPITNTEASTSENRNRTETM